VRRGTFSSYAPPGLRYFGWLTTRLTPGATVLRPSGAVLAMLGWLSPGLRRGATVLRPSGAILTLLASFPRLTPWGYFLGPLRGCTFVLRPLQQISRQQHH